MDLQQSLEKTYFSLEPEMKKFIIEQYKNQAKILFQKKSYKEAIEHYDALIFILLKEPEHSILEKIIINKSMCHYHLEEHEKVLELMEYKWLSNNIKWNYLISCSLIKLNRSLEAKDYIVKAVKLSPNNEQVQKVYKSWHNSYKTLSSMTGMVVDVPEPIQRKGNILFNSTIHTCHKSISIQNNNMLKVVDSYLNKLHILSHKKRIIEILEKSNEKGLQSIVSKIDHTGFGFDKVKYRFFLINLDSKINDKIWYPGIEKVMKKHINVISSEEVTCKKDDKLEFKITMSSEFNGIGFEYLIQDDKVLYDSRNSGFIGVYWIENFRKVVEGEEVCLHYKKEDDICFDEPIRENRERINTYMHSFLKEDFENDDYVKDEPDVLELGTSLNSYYTNSIEPHKELSSIHKREQKDARQLVKNSFEEKIQKVIIRKNALDNDTIGNGILYYIDHLRENHILSEDCKFYPKSSQVYALLLRKEKKVGYEKNYWQPNCEQIEDLSLFEIVSDKIMIDNINFETSSKTSWEKDFQFNIKKEMFANAIVIFSEVNNESSEYNLMYIPETSTGTIKIKNTGSEYLCKVEEKCEVKDIVDLSYLQTYGECEEIHKKIMTRFLEEKKELQQCISYLQNKKIHIDYKIEKDFLLSLHEVAML